MCIIIDIINAATTTLIANYAIGENGSTVFRVTKRAARARPFELRISCGS